MDARLAFFEIELADVEAARPVLFRRIKRARSDLEQVLPGCALHRRAGQMHVTAEEERSSSFREQTLHAIFIEIAKGTHRVVHQGDADESVRRFIDCFAQLRLADEQLRFVIRSALGGPCGIQLQDADRRAAELAHVGAPWTIGLETAGGSEEIGREGVIGLESRGEESHRLRILQRLFDRFFTGE
ncbi:MAG TPA: hypothetical protein VJ901_19325 [Thermoanaerobaculia bacterium]|nr:hypothetical protein [Thermoanaerobaculia bacterium]